MNQSKAIALLTEISNMKIGCAPSAGYMEELIIKARDALERKACKCGNCDNFNFCDVKSDDIACDEFHVVAVNRGLQFNFE